MAVDSDWMDDESLEDEGVFYDPDSGKYFAKIDYTYKGGRSGIGKSSKLGKRKTKGARTFIELNEDEVEQFQSYRDRYEGTRIKGKRGGSAYGGPGREVVRKEFRRGRMEGETYAEYQKAKKEFEADRRSRRAGRLERLTSLSNWWDKERVSGERGKARKELVEAQGNAIAAFRQRFAVGQGWG